MIGKMNLSDAAKGIWDVINEDQYLDIMKNTVAPYLASLRQSVMLKREGSQKLYCEYYKNLNSNLRGSVFISHGFSESCGKYHEVIYYFLKAGYSVCMVEHRGHGHSRHNGESNISQIPTHVDNFQYYVYDMHYAITQVLTEYLPGPYYLFAHSMGGAIGATYLEQHPEVFAKAILTAPMLEINLNGIPKFVAKALTHLNSALGKGMDFLIGQQPFSPEENFSASSCTSLPRYLYYFEQQQNTPEYQNGGSSVQWSKEGLKATERLLKPLNCRKVKVPVLLMQAESDAFVAPGGQDLFISQISNGRIIFVPGSKHEIYLSQNDILEKYWYMIFEFLNQ